MKKVHRFFADLSWQGKQGEILDHETVHQLSRVLRIKPGEELVILDGKGEEFRVRVFEVKKHSVSVDLLGKKAILTEPIIEVVLYASVLKRESFDWAVQKAVECGVSRIVPIISAHTIKTGIKQDRLQAIAKEAAEQCGRAKVPEVSHVMGFEQALAESRACDQILFADTYLPESESMQRARRVALFIGPEG
ncbi:MAG: 16S rRNA (uracil(1498)-N(3))-methyltransferase, partial [Candidatus Magasanikbacteria bacterium]|nr:16S rRNA (uracil(1498)-N(3))-methyltransferase [Candidatus Magasanikbacteria bacterium]